MKTKIFNLILITLLFTSCISDDVVIGSGNLIEKQLTISTFDKIEIISSLNVNLTYGNTQSATLTADDNIIDDISTKVVNNTLVIKYKYDNIDYSNTSVSLAISLPSITHINVTGSSHFKIYNFNDISNLAVRCTGSLNLNFTEVTILNELKIDSTGSLKFTATGSVNDFSIANSGSQKLYCFGFITNNCTIRSSGSGKAEISCNDNLNIRISGSLNVFYKGHPNLTVSSSGSGNVTSAN